MTTKRLSDFSGSSFTFQSSHVFKEEEEETNIGIEKPPVNPLDVLREITPSLNESEIQTLLSTGKFDFDEDGMVNIIEFGELYREKGFSRAYQELMSVPLGGDFSWYTSTLDEARSKVTKIQEAELVVIARDDIGECTKCKSKMITIRFKQMKSSDEPMDTIYRCAKCKAGKTHLIIYGNANQAILQEIKSRKQ